MSIPKGIEDFESSEIVIHSKTVINDLFKGEINKKEGIQTNFTESEYDKHLKYLEKNIWLR